MSANLPLQWVSVKDRLPEKSGWYTAIIINKVKENTFLKILWYENYFRCVDREQAVIAWLEHLVIEDTTIAELVAKWKGQ